MVERLGVVCVGNWGFSKFLIGRFDLSRLLAGPGLDLTL